MRAVYHTVSIQWGNQVIQFSIIILREHSSVIKNTSEQETVVLGCYENGIIYNLRLIKLLILRRGGTGVAVRKWQISPLSRAFVMSSDPCKKAYYAIMIFICCGNELSIMFL